MQRTLRSAGTGQELTSIRVNMVRNKESVDFKRMFRTIPVIRLIFHKIRCYKYSKCSGIQ